MGDGFGVGEIIGEGLGVGQGVGVGAGVGLGVVCETTFQIHIWTAVPFSLDKIVDTFHVPATALVFV